MTGFENERIAFVRAELLPCTIFIFKCVANVVIKTNSLRHPQQRIHDPVNPVF